MRYTIVLILILASSLCGYADFIPTIVKIYDESEIDEYIAAGVQIERRRGDLLLCLFPENGDDQVVIPNGETPDTRTSGGDKKLVSAKKREEFKQRRGKVNRPTLDKALGYFNASDILEGKGFETPYTGKDVVVGFCDIGFDPLHPTFLDEQGHSRVKRLIQYREFQGERIVMEGDEAYSSWVTDSIEENHATHVGGILTGGGAGTPYRGVAYEADIVASVCCLTDFGLLMGVEDIIDYAKEVGKPAVINMSMGNSIGAHDGTSLFSQYIDLCADDAIIVMSAGNDGNRTNTLTYSFENSKPVNFRIGSSDWSQRKMYGITDIWNVSDRPVKVTIQIFDDENHKVVYEYSPEIVEDWESVTYVWDPADPLFEGLSLDGYLTVTGGVDPENGRYEVGLIYDYKSTRLIGTGWAKDMVSVKVEGVPGDDIEVFADGTYTRLMGISGEPQPGSVMSISDLVCGHRVVSVGMYTNRSTYPETEFNTTGEPVGVRDTPLNSEAFGTCVHSSYGTLRDGRVLPLTTAPGYVLVSAYSRPYRDAYPGNSYYLDDNGVPWIAIGGTSMSSPYVAGFIATWVEALPGLTVEDVMEMIAASNRHDIPEPDNPRNINGYFNPVEALRYALDKNGITQIENPGALLLPGDQVEVYNMAGMKVYVGRADGVDSLPKGIYVMKTPYGVVKSLSR